MLDRRTPFLHAALSGTAALGLLSASGAGAAAAGPRAYCAKAVNDDRVRTPPAAFAPAIKHLFNVTGAYALQTTFYRCANGKVLLCNVGANLPCSKANLSKHLPGATAWCRDNPNSDFIPMVATGHDTIYNWHCVDGKAIAGAPISKVDARGFIADEWKALP